MNDQKPTYDRNWGDLKPYVPATGMGYIGPKLWNNAAIATENDRVRQELMESGFDYGKLTDSSLNRLVLSIEQELGRFNASHPDMRMVIAYNRKSNKGYCKEGEDGSVTFARIGINGPYFTEREGVTFNDDGWVGIAGWASSENARPIINGIRRWMKEVMANE